MDIVFTGNFPNPTVVEVPGLLSETPASPMVIMWGADISFLFPDPGVNCTLRLVIKTNVEDPDDIFGLNYVRSSDLGDIRFKIPGVASRQKLEPGFFYWGLLKVVDNGEEGVSYSEIANGIFSISQAAPSLDIPADDDASIPDPTPTTGIEFFGAGIDFMLEGAASLNAVFGFFRVPASHNVECYGTELIVQDAPVGAALLVDILAFGGAVQNKVTTLADGQTLVQTTFGTPLAMAADSSWRAKITQVGSTAPGASIHLRLKLRLTS